MSSLEQKGINNLYNVIKSDDLATFCSLLQFDNRLFKFSLGRFPILSICYLYNSKKIIKTFEKDLIKVKDFIMLDEPFLLYSDFRQKCGKAIRLYANQSSFIMPLEIKAIMGKNTFVKKHFSKFPQNELVNSNLVKIYSLNDQKCYISNKKIKISAKKLSKKAKKTIILTNIVTFSAAAICGIIVLIMVNVFGLGTAASPRKIYSENQFAKFVSRNCSYISLQNDIELNNPLCIEKYEGVIYGNDKTITLSYDYNASMFNDFDGEAYDLNILNKDENITISSDLALFCTNNNGTIKNVKITYSGNLNFSSENDSTFFSGIAVNNYNLIDNCCAMFNANAISNTNKDTFVSAICSINYSTLSNCVVLENSAIETTNTDTAGLCIYNAYGQLISNCKNYADITQNVSSSTWSPAISGVIVNNIGIIENCYNNGKLKINVAAEATASTYIAIGGICASNYARVYHSKNCGDISATCKNLTTYAGGICGYVNTNGAVDNPSVDSCISDCELSFTKNDNVWLYCGGIAGYMRGVVSNCCSASTFTNQFNKEKKVMSALMIGVTLYSYTYSFESGFNLVKYLHLARQNNCFLQSEITTNIVAVAFLANDSNYDDVNNEYNMYGNDIAEDDSQIFITKGELEQNDLYW